MTTSERRTILVIDDDETIRQMIVRQLSTLYNVKDAGDAQKAMATIGTMTPVPDLIICDVMMPGVTGFQFVQYLKTQPAFKSIPVIFLTAKSGPQDVIQGINSGARHYIAKPFSMKELIEKVAKTLAR